jgi:sulfate adenylyltransferase subunit 2
MALTHLQQLEAESIHIMREVVAEAEKPVMLYSIGKDSSVMLHLAMKAFHPAKLPFPLLHVDTTWKFQEMYEFRDRMAKEMDIDLIVHVNPDGLRMNINPFVHGSTIHTEVMKTQALRQALDEHAFDAAFGGARRDEEKSRAKERIFSFRSAQHHWDPKNQRPELWRIYNCRKHQRESIRVFPLSNWTELDVPELAPLAEVRHRLRTDLDTRERLGIRGDRGAGTESEVEALRCRFAGGEGRLRPELGHQEAQADRREQ